MMALAGALASCLLVGAAVDRALLGGTSATVFERLGRALMFGLGSLGALSMAVDAAGLPVCASTVGPAALLLLAVLARPALTARPRPPSLAPLPGRGARFVHGALLAFTLLSLLVVVRSGWIRPTFQFDAVTRWMFKAKVLALDETLRGAASTDPSFSFTHQRYPPLVSHVANLPRLVSGGFDDRVASAMFPWFAVALAGLLYGAVARRAGRMAGAVTAAWVASLPLVAYLPNPPPGGGAFSAMADIPLALFATAAVLAAADAVERRRPRAQLEAALLLGFAALTKNEGLPLVLAVGVAVVLFAREERWRCALTMAGLPLLLYAVLWGWLAASFPALDENYPARLSPDAIANGLHRIPTILQAFAAEGLAFRRWNLTWPAVVVLLALGGRALRARAPRLILSVVALQLMVYAFAFVITGWTSPAAQAISRGGDPVGFLMVITLGRLMLHVAPLAIAAAVIVSPLATERD